MTSEEQLTLVKKALEKNELKELFLGAPGYEWGNLKHIPANVATDIGAIIENGLYVLYNNGYQNITNDIINTIIDLLKSEDAFSIWTAYFILRYQYRNEIKKDSPFYIITPKLCNFTASIINQEKEKLISCKKFAGYALPNGLWDDIQRLENNMLCNYGVSIL